MRNRRPLAWITLVVNLLFLVWLIVGLSGAIYVPNKTDCDQYDAERRYACEHAAWLPNSAIAGLWIVTDLFLAFAWRSAPRMEWSEPVGSPRPGVGGRS
jgi:hypothetical protein